VHLEVTDLLVVKQRSKPKPRRKPDAWFRSPVKNVSFLKIEVCTFKFSTQSRHNTRELKGDGEMIEM